MMLIAWYVPVVGIVAGLVSPLPAAVALIRHGTRWGVLSSVVTMLVLAPVMGWVAALGLWAINGAMGISFGVAVRRGFRPTLVLITAAAGSLVALVAEFASAYFVLGLSLSKRIDEMIAIWNKALEMNRGLLGPNPVLDELAKMMPTREMYMALLPAVAVAVAFVTAYVNFEIFRRILPRLGYTLEGLPPFSRWVFPEFVAYAGILAMLASAAQARFGMAIPGLVRLTENVSSVTSLVFLLDALAVGTFFLLRAGFPRFLAGFLIFMAVTMIFGNPLLSWLASLFGMIDILFDFRQVRFERAEEL